MTETRDTALRGADLYRNATVIDGLNTSRWGSEVVYRSLRDGGVAAINATLAIWEDFESGLQNITDWLGWFEQYSQFIRPVHTVDDIEAAREERRAGVIFGWQNATPLGDKLDRLRLFRELGVRIIQLTYNTRNLLGTGCAEATDDGLTSFGRNAVREMNRLGILIDLSHVGDRTAMDAIEHSADPVAFTHANARSQHDHPRNKTDEAIRLLVEKGGVIGANAWPRFFPNGFDSTLDDHLDAIDYLVNLAGVDHVGIGTDFCQDQPRSWFEQLGAYAPQVTEEYHHLRGLGDPTEMVNVATGLLGRGYDEDDVRKILGGNFLRLFDRVWGGSSAGPGVRRSPSPCC